VVNETFVGSAYLLLHPLTRFGLEVKLMRVEVRVIVGYLHPRPSPLRFSRLQRKFNPAMSSMSLIIKHL